MKHLLYSISSIFNSLEINEKRLDLEYRIKMWEYKKNTEGERKRKIVSWNLKTKEIFYTLDQYGHFRTWLYPINHSVNFFVAWIYARIYQQIGDLGFFLFNDALVITTLTYKFVPFQRLVQRNYK